MKIDFKSLPSKIQEFGKQYGIYIVIMLISAFVRGIPLSSGNSGLDETLNDIAIGAFASTLVAWLIDWQTQRKNKRRNEILRAMILIPFVEAVVHYMEQFCFKSAFMPPEKRSVKGTFLEWSEHYCQLCKSKKDSEDFFPLSPSDILDLVNVVNCQADAILKNEIWLCKENIMTRQDIDNIIEINSTLYAYHLLCPSNDELETDEEKEYLINNIECTNEDLAKRLSQIDELKPLLSVSYSYDIRLSYCIKSLKGIEL